MKKYFHIISLLIVSLGLGLVVLPLTAAVYKNVDEAGNVTYSDEPQKKGDQPVSLPEPTVVEIAPAPKSSTSSEGQRKPAQEKAVKYDSVEIVSPANDETIRSNSGDITVQVSSSPALQGSHLYVIMMDGAKVHESAASSVTLTNVDRGSHTVVAHIQDEKEQFLASSNPITFHLLRASGR